MEIFSAQTLTALSFYLFAGITLIAATQVIFARNTVHSVLFLILSFFSAAGLFVLQGAELLAMILVIVYVGAVAILFLFVVMMLDVGTVNMREGMVRYGLVGGTVGLVLLAELVLIFYTASVRQDLIVHQPQHVIPALGERTNVQAIGDLLYTNYALLFQMTGMILLVAMIGAIVLTLRKRDGVRRQNIAQQNARTIEQAIEMKSVAPNAKG